MLQSALLAEGQTWNRVRLTLRRTKIVTVYYETEHTVTYERLGLDRATSTSVATRISEIADYGTPRQRLVSPGDDHGFLWRWNAYWRFEQTPAGVLAECESISLSRDVPMLLRAVAAPFIRGIARESMTNALQAMRAAFQR